MENKETQITESIKDMSLLVNKPYIAYVFKKTQKIFQAVYLVTEHFDTDDMLHKSIRSSAHVVLTNASLLLKSNQKERLSTSNNLITSLLETLTLLDTACMMKLISDKNHLIFKGEITRVVEVIEQHKDKVVVLGREFMEEGSLEDYKRQSVLYKGQESVLDIKDKVNDFTKPYIPTNTLTKPVIHIKRGLRADRILALFTTGVELMIKDVANKMKDVSEKTIQRELLQLVAKGNLIKKGERRWSRYALRT